MKFNAINPNNLNQSDGFTVIFMEDHELLRIERVRPLVLVAEKSGLLTEISEGEVVLVPGSEMSWEDAVEFVKSGRELYQKDHNMNAVGIVARWNDGKLAVCIA